MQSLIEKETVRKYNYLKCLLIIPAVLFIDWIVMVVAGCVAGLCHAGEKFYCTVYCYSGITLLSLSIAGAMIYILRRKKIC
jgi:hypothetical protein